MITMKDFEKGKEMYYKGMHMNEYAIIKLVKIKETRGQYFTFEAEVVENHGTNYRIGKRRVFSNTFVFKTFGELKKGEEEYHAHILSLLNG